MSLVPSSQHADLLNKAPHCIHLGMKSYRTRSDLPLPSKKINIYDTLIYLLTGNLMYSLSFATYKCSNLLPACFIEYVYPYMCTLCKYIGNRHLLILIYKFLQFQCRFKNRRNNIAIEVIE